VTIDTSIEEACAYNFQIMSRMRMKLNDTKDVVTRECRSFNMHSQDNHLVQDVSERSELVTLECRLLAANPLNPLLLTSLGADWLRAKDSTVPNQTYMETLGQQGMETKSTCLSRRGRGCRFAES